MRFLVQIEAEVPDIPPDEAAALSAREKGQGAEYLAQGLLERIWRVEGRRASVAVWNVADRETLDGILHALPLFQWLHITVTPLATHPLEEHRAR